MVMVENFKMWRRRKPRRPQSPRRRTLSGSRPGTAAVLRFATFPGLPPPNQQPRSPITSSSRRARPVEARQQLHSFLYNPPSFIPIKSKCRDEERDEVPHPPLHPRRRPPLLLPPHLRLLSRPAQPSARSSSPARPSHRRRAQPQTRARLHQYREDYDQAQEQEEGDLCGVEQ